MLPIKTVYRDASKKYIKHAKNTSTNVGVRSEAKHHKK